MIHRLVRASNPQPSFLSFKPCDPPRINQVDGSCANRCKGFADFRKVQRGKAPAAPCRAALAGGNILHGYVVPVIPVAMKVTHVDEFHGRSLAGMIDLQRLQSWLYRISGRRNE
jgi:hypothetical protein